MQKIKLFSMFSGYGGAEFSLRKAKIPYKVVGFSEIDKNAIKCYQQNHPNIKNYGDCKQINPKELPNFDLLTGGFPCQDISIAGSRDLSKGKSVLFDEIIRIVKVKKPKYIVLENVKGILSMPYRIDNGIHTYHHYVIHKLRRIGYGVAWKCLNTKHHGIPQNRERVFYVCKFGGWEFMEFQFPNKEKLKLTIKDILEKNVDKKYFLKKHQIELIEKRMGTSRACKFDPQISNTLRTNYGNSYSNESYILDSRTYKDEKGIRTYRGISPTLVARARTDESPIICALRGRNPENPKSRQAGLPTIQMIEKREDECSNTLTSVWKDNLVMNTPTEAIGRQGSSKEFLSSIKKVNKILSIYRRLTPRECFRLQGFTEDQINLDNLSDSALYKLAGNGWDINLVSKIFKQLFTKNNFFPL